MLILSLDTTTRAGSAAVLDDDLVRAVMPGDISRTHGERLPGELARVLEAAGVTLAAVDLLAVAAGPGAFTGLRIGLAAMQGLALSLDRPVVGVSALEALAVAGFETLGLKEAGIGAWMDAARGDVFAARYRVESGDRGLPQLTPISSPEVGPPDAVWDAWSAAGDLPNSLVGDGAERYAPALRARPQVIPHPLLAPYIGRLARRDASDGRSHRPHQLQPLYVRRPDAERR